MITGIHHFSIIASSEASVTFYSNLGFCEYKRIERGYDTVVLMEGHGVGLEVFIAPSHPWPTVEPLGYRTLSLKVDCFSDSIERYEAGELKTDWNGERYVNIEDPDGNIVQLHE